MRKLFLTSGGLPNETRDAFLKLLGKNPQDTRVAFIPTAKDPEEDQSYVQRSLDQLDELGFVYESTDLKEYSKETLGEKLTQFDVIYVNGGNTFYLLDWIRKSGFDQIIGDLLDQGKIYLGVSAGTIVAGPNIETAGWKNLDRNFLNLTDLTGLNLVPFSVFVHYEPEFQTLIESETTRITYPMIVLTDQQAVLGEETRYKIVGPGNRWVLNDSAEKYA